MNADDRVSAILSDVAEMIARDTFNKNWPNFLADLEANLDENDPMKCQKVFRTLSPVFVKIRNMYRSDELYTMILYTIENFAPAMTRIIPVNSISNFE